MHQKLFQLRRKITILDQQIIVLISKRQHLVRQIGRHKREYRLPARDLVREQQMLQSLLLLGEKYELEHNYVLDLFNVIIQHSLIAQQCYP